MNAICAGIRAGLRDLRNGFLEPEPVEERLRPLSEGLEVKLAGRLRESTRYRSARRGD